jgi:hypothetical protein
MMVVLGPMLGQVDHNMQLRKCLKRPKEEAESQFNVATTPVKGLGARKERNLI